ncbi:MAG TPA: hypothetical protein PLE24_06620 [Chitinispirillaceae bacterium]|jgi:hypothetical protein|nr:hypothetical protein [Chitinispirillaceae bacterium]
MKLTQLFSSVVLITALTQYSQAEGKSGSALALTPVFSRPATGFLPEFFLDKNDTCTIDSTFVDSTGTAWFLIRTGEKNGWSRAESIRFRQDNGKEPEEQNTLNKESEAEKKRRYKIVRENLQWPRRMQQAVREGIVCLDMDEQQLIASWGEPVQKSRAFIIGQGRFDVWFFKSKDGKIVMVSFSDGKVSGWTEKD